MSGGESVFLSGAAVAAQLFSHILFPAQQAGVDKANGADSENGDGRGRKASPSQRFGLTLH